LLLLTQSQSQLGSNAGLIEAFKLLVQHYPKQSYWRDMLVIMRDGGNRATTSDLVTLNLYRLMRGTDTLRESNDFLEMAQLAVQLGSPGEAVDAINRGEASGAFKTETEKSGAKTQMATAQKLAETDRAGLTKFETEAKAAKSGEADVRLGQAFLSYDQADKAVEAIQRGIAKDGLRNADEAQILLGIALLQVGRKPDAATAFKAVKAADSRLGEIAGLWALQAR
jgi:tetratricopeptide (TPR) repeat protein